MDLETLKDQWAQNEEVDGVRLRLVEESQHRILLASEASYNTSWTLSMDELTDSMSCI